MRKYLMTIGVIIMLSSPVMAQSDLCQPATIFNNFTLQTFLKNLKACSADDINAALSITPKDDAQAIACFTTLLPIVTAQKEGGVFATLQAFRNARRSQVLGICSQWLKSTIAPITF